MTLFKNKADYSSCRNSFEKLDKGIVKVFQDHFECFLAISPYTINHLIWNTVMEREFTIEEQTIQEELQPLFSSTHMSLFTDDMEANIRFSMECYIRGYATMKLCYMKEYLTNQMQNNVNTGTQNKPSVFFNRNN